MQPPWPYGLGAWQTNSPCLQYERDSSDKVSSSHSARYVDTDTGVGGVGGYKNAIVKHASRATE
jgi:hypothetical protein